MSERIPPIYQGLLADDRRWLDHVNRTTKIFRQVGMGQRLQYLDANGAYQGPTSVAISFIADTGGIAAGDICAVTDYDATTGLIKLDKADADAAATSMGLWWSPNAVTAGDTGYARKTGVYTSALNTSGATLGDAVYLSETEGLISLTEPATGTDVIVKVGTVASLATAGVIAIDLGGGESIAIHDHTDDGSGGTITIGGALTGTTNISFEAYNGTNEPSIGITGSSGGSGNFTQWISAAATVTIGDATFLLPDTASVGDTIVCKTIAETLSNKTLVTPTIAAAGWANANHTHASASTGGTITISASTGTTNNTFEVNSDGNGVTFDSTGLSQDSTVTFLDQAGPDEIVMLAGTQTMTNKTLTNATLDGIIGGSTPRDASFSTVSSSGAAALASLACTAAGSFGGGYGSDGANISTNGVGQFNGALTTDGVLTADSIVCTEGATFGGGYNPTGATISTAGVGQFDGALTTDGALTANSIVCTTGATFASITGSDGSLGISGLAGSSSNGGIVAFEGGAGDTAGYAGGAITSATGAGVAHTTGTGGASGSYSIITGEAGTATTGIGGASGDIDIYSSAGGAASGDTSTGGASGGVSIATGNGGDADHASACTGGAAGSLQITGGDGGTADNAASTGGDGASVSMTAGSGGASASGTVGDGGNVFIDAGDGGTAGDVSIGATNAATVAVGRTGITTTLNGAVKGESEGHIVHSLVVDASVADINTGHVLVTVPTGRQFQLVDLKQIAIGGTVGTATSVEVGCGATDLTSTTAATLAQSTVLQMDTAGVTVIADGASFAAQTAGVDLSVSKTGGDADTATHVRFIISYLLV